MRIQASLCGLLFLMTGCGSVVTSPTPEPTEACPTDPLIIQLGGGDTLFHVEGLTVAPDSACNVILAATVTGTVGLGSSDLGVPDAPTAFVAKFDPEGAVLWSQALPHWRLRGKRAFAVDKDDSIVVGGVFRENLMPETAAEITDEVTLMKLSDDGELVWSIQTKSNLPADVGYAGAFDKSVESVALDADGNIMLGGAFRGEIDMGGVTLSSIPQEIGFTDYKPDVLVARFDPSGNLIFAKQLGQEDYDRKVGLDVLPGGDTVMVYNGALDQASASEYGLMIIRLSPSGDVLYAKPLEGGVGYYSPSVVATPEGGFVLGASGYVALGAIGEATPAFAALFDASFEPKVLGPFVADEDGVVVSSVLPADSGVAAVGWFGGTLLLHGKKIGDAVDAWDGFEAMVGPTQESLTGAASGQKGDDLTVAIAPAPGGKRITAHLDGPLLLDTVAGEPWTGGAQLVIERR